MNKIVLLVLGVAVVAACATAFLEGHMQRIHQHYPSDDHQEDSDEVEDRSCNVRKLGRCGRRYNRHFGIRKRHPSLQEFSVAFNKLLATQGGRRGWTNICRWGLEMYHCGGQEVYPQCFDMKALLRMGLSKQDAMAVLMIKAELTYECTAGRTVVANDKNWACISRTGKTQIAQFVGCIQKYAKAVKKSPCKATQTLVNCYGGVIRKACGPQCGNNVCNLMKAAMTVKLPKCSLTCASVAELRDDFDDVLDVRSYYEDDTIDTAFEQF